MDEKERYDLLNAILEASSVRELADLYGISRQAMYISQFFYMGVYFPFLV